MGIPSGEKAQDTVRCRAVALVGWRLHGPAPGLAGWSGGRVSCQRSSRNCVTDTGLTVCAPRSGRRTSLRRTSAAVLVGQVRRSDELGRQIPVANLRLAVIDYYRAVKQETEWLDDGLIGLREAADVRGQFAGRVVSRVQRHARRHGTGGADGTYDPEAVDGGRGSGGRKGLLRTLLESTKVSVLGSYHDPFFARGKRRGARSPRLRCWASDGIQTSLNDSRTWSPAVASVEFVEPVDGSDRR